MMITNRTLPCSMKAVVLEAPRKMTYRDIPIWPVESYGDPDMVLVKVAACGVCGSDFRYFAGENPWAMHTLGRHMDNPPNIVLGHEFAGQVEAVVDKKNVHLLGKRVAPICSKVCGMCSVCPSFHDHFSDNDPIREESFNGDKSSRLDEDLGRVE